MSKMGDHLDVHHQKQKRTLLGFLKLHLEAKTISGLSWINKDKEIWQLPWKIHRPTVWGEPDAKVLHAWAVYKYNYKDEEPSRKELSKWKENLRNAILTCPSIREKEHYHEQKISQPFKVYQFVEHKRRNSEISITPSRINNSEGIHPSQSEDLQGTEIPNLPNFNFLTQSCGLTESCRDHIIEDASPSTTPHKPFDINPIQDLDYIQVEDLLGMINKDNANLQNQGEVADLLINGLQIEDTLQIPCKSNLTQRYCNQYKEREYFQISNGGFRSRSPVERWVDNVNHAPIDYEEKIVQSNQSKEFANINLDSESSSSADMAKAFVENPNEVSDALPLLMSVSYVSNEVLQELIMHEKFKLCYVDGDGMRDSILLCPTPAQYGPIDAFLVELPRLNSITCLKPEYSEIVSTVLKHMKRGITVLYSKGDIFVTRYCKAVAYYRAEGGEQVKLERDETVKIFDFQLFKTQFSQAQWSSLTPNVKISFGVKSSAVEVVAVTITHRDAQRMLQEMHNQELQLFTEVDCSLSNEFDTRLSIEQKLKAAHGQN